MIPELAIQDPLCRVKDDSRINCYTIPLKYLNFFFHSRDKMGRYKILFFSSAIVYKALGNKLHLSLFEKFPELFAYENKILAVEHHFDKAQSRLLEKDRVITLADFYEKRQIAVNPHFFGKIKEHSINKGDIIFIVVGSIESGRKNFNLLVKAVKKIHKWGISGFKVVVVGAKIDNIPDFIGEERLDFKGRLPYPEMYNAVEQADFLLPLLDPESREHDRYITTDTSGSFQLVYGFTKPCLIHEKFSMKPGFNANNALVYSSSDGLAECMKRAIQMNENEYNSMREELRKLSSSIEESSRKVLGRMINHE